MRASLIFDERGLSRQSKLLDGRGHELPGRPGDPLHSDPHDRAIPGRYRIYVRAGRWHIENVGKSVDLFVNERRVYGAEVLLDGDLICCGAARVRFSCSSSPLSTDSAPAPAHQLVPQRLPLSPETPLFEAVRNERERLTIKVAQLTEELQRTQRALEGEATRARYLDKQRQQLATKNREMLAERAAAEQRDYAQREQLEQLTLRFNTAQQEKAVVDMALSATRSALERQVVEVAAEKQARKEEAQRSRDLTAIIVELQRDQGAPALPIDNESIAGPQVSRK